MAGLLASSLPTVGGEDIVERNRRRAHDILAVVSKTKDVEKNYYDPDLHGLDGAALTKQARQRIDEASSNSEMFTAIFALVDKLHDSHTFFIPPSRIEQTQFGFDAKAFGNEILIYDLKKGGAAARAGFELGDRFLAVEGFTCERTR